MATTCAKIHVRFSSSKTRTHQYSQKNVQNLSRKRKKQQRAPKPEPINIHKNMYLPSDPFLDVAASLLSSIPSLGSQFPVSALSSTPCLHGRRFFLLKNYCTKTRTSGQISSSSPSSSCGPLGTVTTSSPSLNAAMAIPGSRNRHKSSSTRSSPQITILVMPG
nr:hypothetical protein Iba_scaffold6462CG0360 [Ipomoea batatas]